MARGQILFALSGLGLGNSTRCDAVIGGLQRLGYEIDLFTSGNGERYFTGDQRIRRLHSIEPIDYTSTLLVPYLRNVFSLRKILKRCPYDAVVMDSDYSIALLKRSYPGLVFGINNSDALVSSAMLRLPATHYLHAAVEVLDYLFHVVVSDYVLSPRFVPRTGWTGNRLQVPPIVRQTKLTAAKKVSSKTKKLRVAIVPGGSRYASDFAEIEEVGKWKSVRVDIVGRVKPSRGNIFYHPFTRSVELVKAADILVVNAGFSSLSEAVIYKKPCVTIPLPGHAEQWTNAKYIADHGLGVMATEENWLASLRGVMENLSRYRAAHEQFAASRRGARMVASTIHEKLRTRQSPH